MIGTTCTEEIFDYEVISWEPSKTLEEDFIFERNNSNELICMNQYLPGSEKLNEIMKKIEVMEVDLNVEIKHNNKGENNICIVIYNYNTFLSLVLLQLLFYCYLYHSYNTKISIW